MDLYHELAPGSYRPNTIAMHKQVITAVRNLVSLQYLDK